jgi:hypothetical protein
MVDLNRLQAAALKAALLGGTDDWGRAASIRDTRYSEAYPKGYRSRRMCRCGCGKRATHMGMAKGVALYSGCDLTVARWVRDPAAAISVRKARTASSPGIGAADAPNTPSPTPNADGET